MQGSFRRFERAVQLTVVACVALMMVMSIGTMAQATGFETQRDTALFINDGIYLDITRTFDKDPVTIEQADIRAGQTPPSEAWLTVDSTTPYRLSAFIETPSDVNLLNSTVRTGIDKRDIFRLRITDDSGDWSDWQVGSQPVWTTGTPTIGDSGVLHRVQLMLLFQDEEGHLFTAAYPGEYEVTVTFEVEPSP